MNYSKLTDFNGTPVAEISAGGYTAMIAYELGSNVISRGLGTVFTLSS